MAIWHSQLMMCQVGFCRAASSFACRSVAAGSAAITLLQL